MLLHQPVFDLESWNTLEMAHIPRHDRILPDQCGRANKHIFHANQLAATCQMGKNVSRDDCSSETLKSRMVTRDKTSWVIRCQKTS